MVPRSSNIYNLSGDSKRVVRKGVGLGQNLACVGIPEMSTAHEILEHAILHVKIFHIHAISHCVAITLGPVLFLFGLLGSVIPCDSLFSILRDCISGIPK